MIIRLPKFKKNLPKKYVLIFLLIFAFLLVSLASFISFKTLNSTTSAHEVCICYGHWGGVCTDERCSDHDLCNEHGWEPSCYRYSQSQYYSQSRYYSQSQYYSQSSYCNERWSCEHIWCLGYCSGSVNAEASWHVYDCRGNLVNGNAGGCGLYNNPGCGQCPAYSYSQASYYAQSRYYSYSQSQYYSQSLYYSYSQSLYYEYSQSSYYGYSQSLYYSYSQSSYLTPWIQTSGGDVHSNTNINTPGGP